MGSSTPRRLRRLPAPAPSRADLDELRALLVGPEQRRLGQLEAQLAPEAVGRVLPEAAVASQRQGPDLAWALKPAVVASIQETAERDPRLFIDAIAPVLGPAIRKAVSNSLRALVQQLNETLARGLSLRGLRWRIEALRTGRPFAEVVLLRSLVYRVEQVFLLHGESGLVLQHLVAAGVPPQDPDQVAAMLSAIDAFVHDAFHGRPATSPAEPAGPEPSRPSTSTSAQAGLDSHLGRFQVGELSGWVEHGRLALLVAIVRGNAPHSYDDVLREVLERVHLEYRRELGAFAGDAAPFERAVPLLESCLRSQVLPAQSRRRTRVVGVGALAAIIAALGLLVGLGTYRAHAATRRFTRWNAALANEPGLMVTDAARDGGRARFSGLRDPLARDPAEVLAPLGARPRDLELRFAPFYSADTRLVERRALAALQPPHEVVLSVEGDTLHARGRAPHEWIARARLLAPALTGISHFDTRELADADAEVAAAEVGRSELLFALGSAELRPDQQAALARVRAAVTRLYAVEPAAEIEVVGYADARGGEATNKSLSARRAAAVAAALGLPASAISQRGAGVLDVPDSASCADGRDRGAACARRVGFRVALPRSDRP